MDRFFLFLVGIIGVVSGAAQDDRPRYFYNLGGPTLRGSKTWLKDSDLMSNFATSGSYRFAVNRPIGVSASVPEGTPLKMFQSEIWTTQGGDDFTMTWNTLTGFYEVQLFFAETFRGTSRVGGRVFNVSINGATAVQNLDVFKEVGADNGMMRSINVDCSAGLAITLKRVTQNPMIKGVALIPLCGTAGGLSACPSPPITPYSVQIKRDYGGDGDGETWLPNIGEYQTDSLLASSSSEAITVEAASLPAGVPASLFNTFVSTSAGRDLVLKVPLPAAVYEVSLFFAETSSALAVDREFDIEMEGSVVEPNYNILAEHGLLTAGSFDIQVAVEDGALDLALIRKSSAPPILCGLYVRERLHPRPPLPVQFSPVQSLWAANTGLARATWGPDGSLFVGRTDGKIHRITVDENYAITQNVELFGVHELVEYNIFGMAFNPAQNGPDALYIAHGDINHRRGGCGNGRWMPYPGRVSMLTAPDYDKLVTIITGLPMANSQRSSLNGLEFDNEGNLYLQVGGNTNAGVKSCAMGDLDESPLSGSIVKAEVLTPRFDGNIIYSVDNSDDMNAANGGDAELLPSGARVYASGLRGGFDLEITQDGRMFATDRGPRPVWGEKSIGSITTGPGPWDRDEINHITDGAYYGHPNRNRGRSDARQNFYHGTTVPSSPGVFEQCITSLSPGVEGLEEYTANPFNGALRGQLLVQKMNEKTYNLKLNPDGKTLAGYETDTIPALGADDITVGPGGSIIGIRARGTRDLRLTLPVVPKDGVAIYDIFPQRVRVDRGGSFMISGHGFSTLGSFKVFIGGVAVVIDSHTDARIYGQLPTSMPVFELLDVEIAQEGQHSIVYEKGIQFLTGKDLNMRPRPASAWKKLPDLSLELGEVVAGVINNKLFVFGQGPPFTMALDLATMTWSAPNDYAIRPYPGNHHCEEIYNNKLYIFGGLSRDSEGKLQIFDPVANTWTLGPTIPIASGSANTARIGTKVYYCGGIVGDVTVPDCAVFDLETEVWDTNVAPMPLGRNHAAATTDGKKMYVIGGRTLGNFVRNGFTNVQVYDPVTNTWDHDGIPGFPHVDPMPTPRGGMGQAVYDNERIYVFGGETINDVDATGRRVYRKVEVFNVVNGTWSELEDMPIGMHGIWPVKHDGKIYIATGGVQVANSRSRLGFVIDIPEW